MGHKAKTSCLYKKSRKTDWLQTFFDFEEGFNLTLEWFEIFEDEISKSLIFLQE